MFQHLDDPVPLPPASVHQRQADVARGRALRRRRRGLVAGVPVVVGALAVALTVSSGQTRDSTVAPAAPVPSSPAPTEASTAARELGPGTGTVRFAGAEQVHVTVTLPAGWEAGDVFVTRSGARPEFGLAFFDVAGTYADGCRWVLQDPPVGPTVDDLVAAYASRPGSGAAVRDIDVDGHRGKQVEYTVPDYDRAACRDGQFALFQEDRPHSGNAPDLWAQTPGQRGELSILDVGGTRLVINAGYPPGVSTQDLRDLHAILESVRIG